MSSLLADPFSGALGGTAVLRHVHGGPVPWIIGSPVGLRVTLNSRSLSAGSLPAIATAHPVALVSISFAGTGVNADFVRTLLSRLKDLPAGHRFPAGGFEIATRSGPR